MASRETRARRGCTFNYPDYHAEMWNRGTRLTLVFCAFAAALLLRSVPAYPHVFHAGVYFQGFDPWFHMRTIRNLMHHFPHRSGFDPYSAFPTGQVVPTGPLYDLAIGSIAWIGAAGSPGPYWIDAIGAWFPAVLGALITIPVYFLGRELFDPLTGLFSAWVIALLPGEFLMVSILGFTDHHVAESLLSTLVLLFLVRATRSRPALFTILAGISLGAFLAVRPAGAFLVLILLLWAIVQCGLNVHASRSSWSLWRIIAPALFIAWLLFLPVGGIMWSQYTLLALWTGIAAVTFTAAVANAILARNGPAWLYAAALGIAVFTAAAFLLLFRPALAGSLATEILQRARPAAQTVREMQPLLWPGGAFSLRPAWSEFAATWLFAIPGAFLLIGRLRQTSNAALLLFFTWSAVMGCAAFLEYRMAVYAAVAVAVLAAFAASRLWRMADKRDRWLAAVAIAGVLFYPEVSIAWTVVTRNNTPPADWRSALAWLRDQTPEPLPPADFDRFYPRLSEGRAFSYPPSAYGIMNWWDYGHWISAIARRIPVSNGMQTGAATAARFFTSTDPAQAALLLAQTGAHYVIADSSLPVPQGSRLTLGGAKFIGMAQWAGKRLSDYCENVRGQLPDGRMGVITLFYPAYYRTMLARLYLFDAKAVEPQDSTFVIEYSEDSSRGKRVKTITGLREFPTYEEAIAYQRIETGKTLLAGLYPSRPCVPIEKSGNFKLVYTSQPDTATQSEVRAVKIFALQR